MKFGYLGQEKLDVSGEWKDTLDSNDIGKYVMGRFNYSGVLGNHIIGKLESKNISGIIKPLVINVYCYAYKVISKETYDLLTS